MPSKEQAKRLLLQYVTSYVNNKGNKKLLAEFKNEYERLTEDDKASVKKEFIHLRNVAIKHEETIQDLKEIAPDNLTGAMTGTAIVATGVSIFSRYSNGNFFPTRPLTKAVAVGSIAIGCVMGAISYPFLRDTKSARKFFNKRHPYYQLQNVLGLTSLLTKAEEINMQRDIESCFENTKTRYKKSQG